MIQSQMAAEYTWSDVKHAGQKAAAAASALPDKVNETVQIVTGEPMLGDPIDEKKHGRTSSVYAVESGEVTGTGEDEAIGKYVRISHGKSGESLYGNLEKVLVKSPAKVKPEGRLLAHITIPVKRTSIIRLMWMISVTDGRNYGIMDAILYQRCGREASL